MNPIKDEKLELINKLALIRAEANSPVELKKAFNDDELMSMDDEYMPVITLNTNE